MANFLGNLSVFDHKIHEWEVFYGKLTQFLKLNNIAEVNQSAVLLTHLSDESYRLLRNLVHPKKLEENNVAVIVNDSNEVEQGGELNEEWAEACEVLEMPQKDKANPSKDMPSTSTHSPAKSPKRCRKPVEFYKQFY